ncbi:MAG TPA: MgtC/SapB family protein [Thermoanaerobaculia bacterium]|nr:MgtC/SapB family protein [Thermoanaerobaculia bacterium]
MIVDVETAAVRLALALLAGVLIGLEREWRQKNAGIKTNALVALGAAGFALISDPESRIVANVVTGIGFIGAGVIMHRGVTVQGVTTAATLWANAAMSLAIALGRVWIGALLLAGIMIVQFVMRHLDIVVERARRSRVPTRVEVVVHCADYALPAVNEAWKRYSESQEIKPVRRAVLRGHDDHFVWRAVFVAREGLPIDLTTLEETLVPEPGVIKVEARWAGVDDGA